TLVLVPDAARTGAPLLAYLVTHAVTHVTLLPSVLRTVPAAGRPRGLSLIVAGEACEPDLVASWAETCARVVNAYGPTEATVCVTMSPPLAGRAPTGPPIGVPLPN